MILYGHGINKDSVVFSFIWPESFLRFEETIKKQNNQQTKEEADCQYVHTYRLSVPVSYACSYMLTFSPSVLERKKNMYDYNYLKNMLWSSDDSYVFMRSFIRMKYGPYTASTIIIEGEKIIIPDIIVKEYTKLIQREYDLYKREHYSETDSETGERTMPLISSLESYSNQDALGYIPSFDNDVEDRITVHDSLRKLRKKNKLYHKIIVLYFFRDLNIIEIADITGITRQTISKKLFDAKKELRKILEGSDDNESDTDNNIPANGQKAR